MAGKVFEHSVEDDGGALTLDDHGFGVIVEHFLGDLRNPIKIAT